MIIQNLHFFSLIVFLFMSGYILYRDPKSQLNRTCSLLISSFAVWNIVDVFGMGMDISEDTAILLLNISSIGWISFASFFLCFSLVFSQRMKLFKKNWYLIFVFIIPLVFIYQQWTNSIVVNPYRGIYGWAFTWKDTIWSPLFYAYYISFTLISVYFIFLHGKRTQKILVKKQSKIIGITALLSLFGGTITDIILPLLHVQTVPILSDVILLVFAGGMIYAIIMYEFLVVTPAIAAEKIISAMEELLVLLDNKGNILDVNNAVSETLKFERKELVGKTLKMLFKEDNLEDSLIARIVQGETIKNCEAGLLDKNITEIPILFSCSPLRNNEGEIIGIVFVARDITEKKNAEIKLFEGQQVFRSLVENSPDIIARYDTNCQRTYVNPMYLKVALIHQQDLLSTSPNQLSPLPSYSAKILEDMLRRVLTSGVGEAVDLIWPKADNIEYWYNVYAFPEFNREGNVISVMSVSRDITASKQAESDLIRAKEKAEESDQLKSAFLANMSHEIRTPMNGIMGFAELLKEPQLSGNEQQQYIGMIEEGGVRLLNIINNLISISKVESGQMGISISETNISEQIEYVYYFLKPKAESKRIKIFFKTILPLKAVIIKTDREKVYAVLTNLVNNAIKFTNEGSIEFGYEKKGNYLEFFVKDTGIGIPKDKRDAVFERFIQADIFDKGALQGAGLGLTISKAYVEMLGGKIWVESEEGKGSIFYFTIPYTCEAKEIIATKEIVAAGNEPILIKSLKILIAEDDETSDLLLTLNIEKISCKVLHTKSGVETVEACRNNTDIDLVLMDIGIPDMNGYEATQQIREFNKDVIIIAQTAYGLEGDREKAIKAGCNDYIAKPIKKDDLLALIQKYFHK